MKPADHIADDIANAYGPRSEKRWLGLTAAVTAAIERARAAGLVAGFRAARTDGDDVTAALRTLGVSEVAYREAVAEMDEDERTTT